VATAMDVDEARAFLARSDPALLAAVGTIRGDGSPQVVPVWYRWDGERFLVWSTETRAWVRHLRRDPRIAVSVQETTPPFAAALLRGAAEVHTGAAAWITDEIRAITRRYIATAEVDAYVAGWGELRTIVSLRPETITGWSRGY
jgi:PPOX class probable F420-dependent enzyme